MTITAGKQVVALAKGNTTVYIEAIKAEEILANQLIKIPRPIVKGSQDDKNPGTMTIDLKRLNHLFNIQGYLSTEAGSGNESLHADADAARIALITNIIYPKGDIELHYRNYKDSDYGDYYGDGSTGVATDYVRTQLDKISFQDASLRTDEGSTLVRRYLVQLSLTRGKIK